jgi:uroporphyrinogen decarboxylase
MNALTSRERVITALSHHEPDRVPFDCTFTYEAYQNLVKWMGFPNTDKELPHSPSLNVSPPINFLEELKVDLHYIGLNHWKNELPFEYGMDAYTDIWGVGYKKIDNNGRLEYPNVSCPLSDASVRDLEHFPWPDPYAPELVDGLKERTASLHNETNFALVGKFSTSIFEQASALRGMERLYMDFALNPEFVETLFRHLVDIAVGLIETGLKACGSYIQILRLAGDDMGGQRNTLFKPEMFRQMIKPHFARLYGEARRMLDEINPEIQIMGHTDGDVYPIIPDYIEIGLNILNPVQPYVAEMDHNRLKQEFGGKLSFHGGIDLQKVMPFGTEDEVVAEVKKAMRALGGSGGYILAPTHYLLADVPPENIIALRDAVMTYGHYPLD